MNNYLNFSIIYNLNYYLDNNKIGIIKFLSKDIFNLAKDIPFTIDSIIDESYLLKWYLNYFNFPKENINIIYALKKNYRNVLLYLKSYWNNFTVKKAIQYSNKNTIKFLVENGCPLNTWSIAKAVNINDIEIVKFLKNYGCEWDYWSTAYAARHSDIKLLKWLINNNCPYNCTSFRFACSANNIKAAEYLYSINCNNDSSLYGWAAKNNNVEMLNWLYEHRINLNNFELDKYIRSNNYQGLLWLSNKVGYNKKKCLIRAQKLKNYAFLDYLKIH